MTAKGRQRTPPDLMSELLGSLQQEVSLPGQRPPEPEASESESTEQLDDKSTSVQVEIESSRLVDLSARPQQVKTQTRKRDGAKLTRKTHYLTPEQVRRLKEYAFMTGTGESEVVRQALEEFFALHGEEVWSTGG